MSIVLYFFTGLISFVFHCLLHLEVGIEADLQLVESCGAPAKDTHVNKGFAGRIVQTRDLKGRRNGAGASDQDQPNEW